MVTSDDFSKVLIFSCSCKVHIKLSALAVKMIVVIMSLFLTYFIFCCYMQTASAKSWTCMDLYVFATPYRITWDYYFAAREHTLEIKSWEEEAELEYVCFLPKVSFPPFFTMQYLIKLILMIQSFVFVIR